MVKLMHIAERHRRTMWVSGLGQRSAQPHDRGGQCRTHSRSGLCQSNERDQRATLTVARKLKISGRVEAQRPLQLNGRSQHRIARRACRWISDNGAAVTITGKGEVGSWGNQRARIGELPELAAVRLE